MRLVLTLDEHKKCVTNSNHCLFYFTTVILRLAFKKKSATESNTGLDHSAKFNYNIKKLHKHSSNVNDAS